MSTRNVSVFVFSYPVDYITTLSYTRLLEIREVLEFKDKFLTSKSLEQLLAEYIDKVDVYASFIDDVRCYRIVLKDNDRRIFKIHKA